MEVAYGPQMATAGGVSGRPMRVGMSGGQVGVGSASRRLAGAGRSVGMNVAGETLEDGCVKPC